MKKRLGWLLVALLLPACAILRTEEPEALVGVQSVEMRGGTLRIGVRDLADSPHILPWLTDRGLSFYPRACNPASGWEKGKVERAIGQNEEPFSKAPDKACRFHTKCARSRSRNLFF